MLPEARRSDLAVSVVIALATWLVFRSSISFGFVYWNDNLQIFGNPHIQSLGWKSLAWMFSDTSLDMTYCPLTWLDWALLYRFAGFNPRVFHLEALGFHILNTLLVFYLTRRLLTSKAPALVLSLAAGLSTLLWALHPWRVEVASWASQERVARAVFFALVAVLGYLRAVQGGGSPWRRPAYWASILAALVSFLTHSVAWCLALVLFALDIYPLRRPWKDQTVLLEKLPYAIPAALVFYVGEVSRFFASGSWVGWSSLSEFGVLPRLVQAGYIWARDILRPFAPIHPSPVYTTLVNFDPKGFVFLASVCFDLAFTGLAWALRRRGPALLVAWVCYLVLMIPFLGLSEQSHLHADRYSYLSAVPSSVLVATALVVLWNRSARLGETFAFLLGVLVCVLGSLSYRQTFVWRDSEALFHHILQGLPQEDPFRADIHFREGVLLFERGDYKGAIGFFDLAKGPFRYLGLMYKGRAQIALGDLEGAAETYRSLVRAFPTADPHRIFGEVLEKEGRLDEAKRELEQAVELSPLSAEAHLGLGRILARMGKRKEAIQELRQAVILRSDLQEARDELGRLGLAR